MDGKKLSGDKSQKGYWLTFKNKNLTTVKCSLHWALLYSSVLLVFQRYMTQRYLIDTHFCSFLGLTPIIGWEICSVGEIFFEIFEISFPWAIYHMTILNEHPFLVILTPQIDFWAKQENDGKGNFFCFLKSPFHRLPNSLWHNHA